MGFIFVGEESGLSKMTYGEAWDYAGPGGVTALFGYQAAKGAEMTAEFIGSVPYRVQPDPDRKRAVVPYSSPSSPSLSNTKIAGHEAPRRIVLPKLPHLW
jgi:hypothetical protein